MNRFQVEKIEVRAQINLADGSSEGGSLFLSPVSPSRSGPQTVLDLLEETASFLPLKNDRGDFLMIGKENIVSIHAERNPGEEEEYTRSVSTRLRLLGGTSLYGQLIVPVVHDAFRVSDYLNGPDVWVRVVRDEAFYWVRKSAILEIRV